MEHCQSLGYFCLDNPHDDDQVQPLMTTLHQFKENMILLSTMYEIKKIVPTKNRRKFRIKCLKKNYKQGINAIRKRHKKLFKDTISHQYNFPASNEWVMTLPYQFVDSLKRWSLAEVTITLAKFDSKKNQECTEQFYPENLSY